MPDLSLKLPRSELWPEADTNKKFHHTFVKLKVNVLAMRMARHLLQLQLNDGPDLFFTQRLENDYLVYPVKKLRSELLTKFAHDLFVLSRPSRCIEAKARRDFPGTSDDVAGEVAGRN